MSFSHNLAHMMGLLDRALEHKPDLVCLPETFATSGMGGASACERADPARHSIPSRSP